MIQKLKEFWHFLFGDSVKVATKKSDAIFNVFTQTQTNVQKLNAQINTHVEKKTVQVAKVNDQISTLNAVAAKNEKLANKIGEFLKTD